MKNKQHIKSKKHKHFSLLIVPQSKPTKQIKIANWIPKVFSFILVTSFSLTTIWVYNMYTSYNFMKVDYQSKIDKIDELNKIKKTQEKEIVVLKEKTLDFENKLAQIEDLQDTVKDMVGLPTDDTNEKKIPLASRSNTYSDFNIKEVNGDMIEISRLLDQSEENLNCLISDVEKRLNFLSAEPNDYPCKGKLTSGFGYRKNPTGRGLEFHKGLDIANNYGTNICASGNGIVIFSGYRGSYGKVIIISHGYGYESFYGHNSKLLVKVGEKVEKGQLISQMGNTGRSTGTHVHFEIRKYGKAINPYNVLSKKE
ncbi:M23 family metallopeptidase [Clostridiaceae bacterium M8S5]|nr:M23 family metallopeptidase [Clostridiaceae bacterium M8S5]